MCASSRAITPLTCSPGPSTLNSQDVNIISSLNREFLRTLNHFSRVVNLFSPCDRDTISVFLLPSPDRAPLIGARLCRKDVSVLLSGFCSSDKLRPPDRGQFINIHKPVSVDEQKFRVDYRSFFQRATLRNTTCCPPRCPQSLSPCISLNIFLCFRSRNPDVEATAGGCGGHQLPGHPGPEHQHSGADTKTCCGVVVSQTVSIRWFIVMIAFVGICCAVVGTVLGAMKASGREHLTVSLLMIGQYLSSPLSQTHNKLMRSLGSQFSQTWTLSTAVSSRVMVFCVAKLDLFNNRSLLDAS